MDEIRNFNEEDEDLLEDEIAEDGDEENEAPMDPEMELQINDYIEYVEDILDNREFYNEEELTDFQYLGNPEALKKKELWAEMGCRPLPDEFYEVYGKQVENEKLLIVASNKKEFLLELIHEIEQTELIEYLDNQNQYIETMEEIMEQWRAEGELMALDPDTGEYYYDPPNPDEEVDTED
jgi:hypothetical protein